MRTTKYIYLNPSDVQNFVHAAEHCDFDIDIANDRYGRYVVDDQIRVPPDGGGDWI